MRWYLTKFKLKRNSSIAYWSTEVAAVWEAGRALLFHQVINLLLFLAYIDDTYVPANLLSISIMTFPMLSLYKEKNSRTYYYWYLWWMGAFCAFSGSEKISPLSTNLFHLCQCQFLEFPICLKTAAACMSSCTSTNDSSSQHCHQIENQGNHVNKQRYRSQLFSNPW